MDIQYLIQHTLSMSFKKKDFGEYFLKYFSDIKEMFSQITKENLNNSYC